jgi:hypothetical protein
MSTETVLSKIYDNKVIHIVSEVVVLLGITFYFNSKNKKLTGQLDELAQRVEEQENHIQKLENAIQQLNRNLTGLPLVEIVQKLDAYDNRVNALENMVTTVASKTMKPRRKFKKSELDKSSMLVQRDSKPVERATQVVTQVATQVPSIPISTLHNKPLFTKPEEQPIRRQRVQIIEEEQEDEEDHDEEDIADEEDEEETDSDLDDEIQEELSELEENESLKKTELP